MSLEALVDLDVASGVYYQESMNLEAVVVIVGMSEVDAVTEMAVVDAVVTLPAVAATEMVEVVAANGTEGVLAYKNEVHAHQMAVHCQYSSSVFPASEAFV